MTIKLEDGMIFEGKPLMPKLTTEEMVGQVGKTKTHEEVDVHYFGVYLGTAHREIGQKKWGWKYEH